MFQKQMMIWLLAVLAGPATAVAEDAATPLFSFDGFGTLGAVHSNEHRADFTASVYQPTGAGATRNWSKDVDSLLGAQVTAHLLPQLSAVVQVIAQQNYDGSYQPHVEWANLKYELTPDLSARVGRTALPSFMVNDSRKVGYANPWVRPPLEVYSLSPVTSNDGVDLSYRIHFGTAVDTVQMTFGRSDAKVPTGASLGSQTARSRGQMTFADTFERGFTTLRVNYSRTTVSVDQIGGLFDALRQSGAVGESIADRFDITKQHTAFFGAGGSYDPGRWFVMGEWVRTTSNSVLNKRTGWYVTGGYRLGNVTPYATYGAQSVQRSFSDPGFTVAELPAYLAVPATQLLDGLKSISGGQHTLSGGVRWDFMKDVALKAQYDRTNLNAGSPGTLRNMQASFQPGRTYDLISITVDFVF